ncbi:MULTISPECIES: phage tail tape measure protein [Pseudoalteromonas]|uniref:phage tail tape measure protein n=2 Tax=Pseudoalteromonas TaxID=53246 RepID=UPI0002C8C438|nr:MULTISPECIES: phage tail tape measure protein [Pseudoalteromonas]ENN96911.1 phage-related tail protein [Pseudoalteromonas agarivorans S816]TMS68504.1 phage tail tape measure protein [Pseudoalteromonas sp. S1731]TMS69908.1 phage tail tape measure protein [Pseudoalteromonas sp. S1941]TMS75736.1 phage tail tape measure protein [Pseudoalteromonas sp. S1690]TMS82652.1 phage tail tape measure protein [Pseudoalteromonas sp. S981]
MATLSKLDKLNYSIGIIDKVTGPVNKVMAKINQLSQQTAAAQDQMMRGAATAVAGGYALARSLAPAIDQAAALGEVKSLGVVDESLQKLNKTSLEFTANFGGNASDFVRSAYDIQSAMSGITGDELSKVTEISNVLAKATKADAATVTDYMGTMYGVFKDTADKMGKVKWAEDIAGITAKAVTDYKTDGKEMASAFSALGASSSAPIAEQIAILGRLQSTMSGSESATKLKAFEAGAGKAQKALGLNFTDSSGQLLPMVDILQLINDKTNGLTKQVDIDAIASAFGSAEASSLIKLLIKDIDGLDNQVKDLSNISGMANVAKMADDMKTPWSQLAGSFNSASIALGQRLLPVVEPFVSMLASMFNGIVSLTEQFPVLSSAIATVIVGVVGLVTAFGLVNFAMGLFKYASVVLTPIISGLKYATALYSTTNKALAASLTLSTGATNKARAVSALTTAQTMAQTKATQTASIVTTLYAGATNKARIAYEVFNARLLMPAGLIFSRIKALGFMGTLKLFPAVLAAGGASFGRFAGSLFSVTRIMGFLNAVMIANPIGAIIALVAILALVIYKYWQPIKAFMSGFWDGFVHSMAPVTDLFSELGDAFAPIINAVKSAFNWFVSLFAPVEKSSEALEGITSAGEVFGLIFGSILNLVLAPIKLVIWGVTKLINGITWLGSAIGSMWTAVQSPLGSFFEIIKTIFGFTPMGMLMKGYGKAFDWLSEKVGGLKGVADSIKDFFGFGDDEVEVKATKVTQAVQPQTMVMQSADQAYSRDYGQSVISKANAPAQQASSQYVAPSSPVNYAAPKATTIIETEGMRKQALAEQAANDPAYSAQPKVMTEREAAQAAFKFTSQRLPAVPTDTTAPLNLQAQARSQALINNAFPSEQNNAVTNSAVSAAQNNAVTNSAVSATQNNAATVTNSATSTAINEAVNSSVANAAQNNLTPIVMNAQPKAMTEREAAQAAFKFTSQRLPAVPTDTTAPLNLQAQARSQALINNAFSSEQNNAVTNSAISAAQSNAAPMATNTVSNITNAANSPVYSPKQAQLVSVNQGAAPEPALPSVKTDQVITNTASNSAEKAQQISAEQQATAYKPKLQKSAYLQSLTNNSSSTNNNSNSSDSSKHISIENVNFKSDDLAQSFEQMMELAG